MALRTIRIIGDEILEHKAKPVKAMTPHIETLIEDMLDTMYVDNVTKDFQTGLVLEGVETHAKANIVYIESQSNGAKMMLSNRVGSFYTYADKRVNDNEIVEVVQYSKHNSIEISSSGRIRQIVESDVYNNRGNVIYIENLKPIDRKEGQMEIFLLTIEL